MKTVMLLLPFLSPAIQLLYSWWKHRFLAPVCSGVGRSSLDIGGIIMSNILSDTLAQERRRFFFSSPEADADAVTDCGECADMGAGAEGDR